MPHIPDYVTTMKPYQAGNQMENPAFRSDVERLILLASNENPIGPSPNAVRAIVETASTVSRYPDPGAAELVDTIATKHDKQPEQIICTNGSEALLTYIVTAFSETGSRILTASGTFVGMFVSAIKSGRKLDLVPLKDYAFDLDALYENIKQDTHIIYLANPNNPTGSMISEDELTNFIERVPRDIIIVLDEAYSLYASQHAGYPDSMNFDFDNVLVVRTLSKSYGLAGLRVGYGVGFPEHIGTLRKVKNVFEPSVVAQKAAAAAINDEAFVAETLRVNNLSLRTMVDTFEALHIPYIPPRGNFIMILLPSAEFAADFYRKCCERGVIVRHVHSFGIPNGVRISTGTVADTEYAVNIFKEVYSSLGKTRAG